MVGHMRRLLIWCRNKFHPLFLLRRSALFRALASKASVTIRRKFRGRTVYADAYRNLSFLMLPNSAEIDQFTRIIRILAPSSFWDIGANIGYYAWAFLSECPGSKVVLFEPDARNIGLLRKTIGVEPIVLIEKAVSDRAGVSAFNAAEISGYTGTITPGSDGKTFIERHHGAKRSGGRLVETTTIDETAAVQGPPDFLKIDTEGADLLVLLGGLRTIRENHPAILIETIENAPEIKALLAGLDYRLFDPETLLEIGDGDRHLPNVFAVPSKRADVILGRAKIR